MRSLLFPFVRAFIMVLAYAPITLINAQAISVQDNKDVLRLGPLVREALLNSESLRAARLNAAAKWAVPRQASSLPDPVIEANYQPYPVYTARGVQRSQFRIEQAVPFPGKLALKGQIEEYSAKIADYDVGISARFLVYQVKTSYFELYRSQEQIRLLREFREQLSDFVASTTSRYKVGDGTQQDILKAQLERNTLDQVELELTQRMRSEAETLARLLNRPSGVSLLSSEFDIERQPAAVDSTDYRSLAERQRPEVLARRAAIERAEAEIRLARKMFLPDFSIGISYFDIGANDLTPTMTGRDALALQLKVRVPLWRDRLHAKLEESRAKSQASEALFRDLRTEISTQIGRLASQLELEERTLQLYEGTLIPQAESALESSISAYSSNRADFMSLLDAERMLFNLRMSFHDSLARSQQFSAALEWALGVAPPEVSRPQDETNKNN